MIFNFFMLSIFLIRKHKKQPIALIFSGGHSDEKKYLYTVAIGRHKSVYLKTCIRHPLHEYSMYISCTGSDREKIRLPNVRLTLPAPSPVERV